jgi:hypothetical protein
MALTGVTIGAGCASSVPPPRDQWAAAQADVGQAEGGGTPDQPDAMLHLRLAQEDLQKAKQLMGDDNKQAASLCALASAESQLALSLAKQAAAQSRALKAQSDLQSSTGK